MLFVIFVPYSMLPLPLKWCIIGGSLSGTSHLISITIVKMIKANAVSGQFLYLSCGCTLSAFFGEFGWEGHSRNYLRMMNILLQNRLDMHYVKCTPTNAERIDGQRFQMRFFMSLNLVLTFSLFYRSVLFSTDPRHFMRNALWWHGVHVQTATRVYGAQAAVERLAIFGHQFCRYVYKVSNGSRSTLGIYGDAQSHGAEEGLGEGVSAHPETARLKWVLYSCTFGWLWELLRGTLPMCRAERTDAEWKLIKFIMFHLIWAAVCIW